MNVKLLICDDEKIIREGLASLDWNTRGSRNSKKW